MIEFLDSLSALWATRMQTAIVWSFILPVTWLATNLLHSLSRSRQSWLWRIAYLKLLLIMVLPVTLQLPLLQRPAEQTVVRRETAHQQTAIPQVATFLEQPPHVAQHPLSICLVLAWMVGVFWLTGHYIFGWRQVRRLIRAARICPSDSSPVTQLDRLREEMLVRARVGLRMSDEVPSPCVVGILRPTILLPESLQDETVDRLQTLLSHELAHVARRDLSWNLVQATVRIALFFHPFIWLLQRHWRLTQEAACDEMALHATKTTVSDYARIILDLSRPSRIPSLPPTAVGSSEFPLLKRRLQMLRAPSTSRLPTSVIGSFICAAIAGVLLAPWQFVYAVDDNANTKFRQRPIQGEMEQIVKQKFKGPFYKVTLKDVVAERQDWVTLAPEGMPVSLGIGRGTGTYRVVVSERKGDKVRVTFVWEEQAEKPRSIDGQEYWTSHFTKLTRDIELGKQLSITLVSPRESTIRKEIPLKVEPHETNASAVSRSGMRHDERIGKEIVARIESLKTQGTLGNVSVDLSVEGGNVTLVGHVATDEQLDVVDAEVRKVQGVRQLRNKVAVRLAPTER